MGACAPATSPEPASWVAGLGGDSSLVPVFEDAARGSGVPADVLATVAFVKTRLRMGRGREAGASAHGLPPEVGMMGIRDVEEGARLLGVDPALLSSDVGVNVRAAAALLAVRA